MGCSGAAAPIGDEVLKNGEIRSSVRSPLEGPAASQACLRPSQSGLRASQAGLRALEAWLAGSEAWLAGSEAWLAGSEAWLVGSEPASLALRPDWPGLRPAWLALGPSRGGTDGRTDLPILKDFVPYRGRCPASAQLQPKKYIKRGKGTADHVMPLGDWLL